MNSLVKKQWPRLYKKRYSPGWRFICFYKPSHLFHMAPFGVSASYPIPICTTCWNIIFTWYCLCKSKDTKVSVHYVALCALPFTWSFINRSKQKWFFKTKILMPFQVTLVSWLSNFKWYFIGWRIWVKYCTYCILILPSCVSGI